MKNTSLKNIPLGYTPVKNTFSFSKLVLWLTFFAIIYVILLVKIFTWEYLNENIFFGFYSLTVTFYILSRFVLAYFHSSTLPVNNSFTPSVSFVVPAKNEGDNIAETLRRFGQVEYPKHKIEVIAINDGSTDNTLDEMKKVQSELGPYVSRFEVVDWKVNKGKREGMAAGVKMAKGEIIIFIDSDSFIEKDCVYHLVKHFANPSVGAVSGHTDVHNSDTNLLTKMQAVRYYISFKIYKAAESVFGLVTCCPGCCSAYRREYLMEFIDEWLNQKFLGKQCTFGDDRSLTNYVLRKYKAIYSEEARARTIVPDKFRTYIKQQQRWKKSWVRETIIASSFMWRVNPLASIFFYLYVFLAFAGPVVFIRAVVWNPYFHGLLPAFYLFGLFLMLLLHGIYYKIQAGEKNWFKAVVFFWFSTIVLIWQLPWAMVTIANNKWGTR